ncbi:hypothetical protein ACHAWF_002533 [Thalassiosira exigua]
MSSSTKNSGNAARESTKAKQKINEIHRRVKTRTPEPEEDLARQVVPKLAARAYHLPGYNLIQDWLQYIFNNHPLFGICCHHRLHPLKMRQRLIILLGSFAAGVAITNVIYLWFLASGSDDQKEVFSLDFSTQQTDSQSFTITRGFFVLVTVGSGSHSIFDRLVWSLAACGCCRPGGRLESQNCCRNLGFYLVIFLIVVVVALATCIVVVRASMDHNGQTMVPLFQNLTFQNMTKDNVQQDLEHVLNFNEYEYHDYSFLKGYALEFIFSVVFWTPLIDTTIFSGILGCFRLPILGGRPAAMKRESKMQSQIQSVPPVHLA